MPISISGSGTITGITAGGLPDAIITQPELATGVAGTGPAFSAYQSSSQALATATNTKITLQTEEFDTNSNFDSTTNYRFTPTVAGYYQVNGRIEVVSTVTEIVCFIYKNGSKYKSGSDVATNSVASVVSALVFLNGTTDYVELYGLLLFGQTLVAAIPSTFFQAAMVRGA